MKLGISLDSAKSVRRATLSHLTDERICATWRSALKRISSAAKLPAAALQDAGTKPRR